MGSGEKVDDDSLGACFIAMISDRKEEGNNKVIHVMPKQCTLKEITGCMCS